MSKQRLVPRRLYKYRAIDAYTESLLERREIWFSSPSDFNDPFDCAFQVSLSGMRNNSLIQSQLFQTAVKMQPNRSADEHRRSALRVSSNPKFRRELEVGFSRNLEQMLRNERNSGVCCFTTKRDSLLMWSHYAANHTGVCIEFATAKRPLSSAREVVYDDQFPVVEGYDVVTNDKMRLRASWMLQKATAWKYESEWRVISDKGRGIQQLPPSAITGLIFGCRTAVSDRERLCKKLKYRGIPLYQASLRENEFKIDIKRLGDSPPPPD